MWMVRRIWVPATQRHRCYMRPPCSTASWSRRGLHHKRNYAVPYGAHGGASMSTDISDARYQEVLRRQRLAEQKSELEQPYTVEIELSGAQGEQGVKGDKGDTGA